jgi:hypothetical protein
VCGLHIVLIDPYFKAIGKNKSFKGRRRRTEDENPYSIMKTNALFIISTHFEYQAALLV